MLVAANKSIIGSFGIQVSVILTRRKTAPPSHGCPQLFRPSMSPRRSAVELRLHQGELPHGLARPCWRLRWPVGAEGVGLGVSHCRALRNLARSPAMRCCRSVTQNAISRRHCPPPSPRRCPLLRHPPPPVAASALGSLRRPRWLSSGQLQRVVLWADLTAQVEQPARLSQEVVR